MANRIILILMILTGISTLTAQNITLPLWPDSALVRYYSNEYQVRENTPPAFLLHAGDDKAVPVENSLVFYQALLEKGIPAEMHIYPEGGHGFSLAIGTGHLSGWPARCADWLLWLDEPGNR